MTQATNGPGAGQPRSQRTALVLLLSLLAVLATAVGLETVVPMLTQVTVQQPASAHTRSPARPQPRQPTRVVVIPKCFQHPTATHFFADSPKGQLEGPNSFGPTLVPPGLRPSDIPTSAQEQATARAFLERMCLDWQLANATLSTLHHRFDPFAGTSRVDVLSRIAGSAHWDLANLWYGSLPKVSWTYGMIAGYPPTIYPAQYDHGPSWFLAVPQTDGTMTYFRLRCGGQGVINAPLVDTHIPRV